MSEKHEDPNMTYHQSYYKFSGKSRWMEKIWSEAFEDNYPKALDHYGYVTLHDLKKISSLLQLSSGKSMLDIGCGKGGPGLKLAEQLDLKLKGIDIVPEAVLQANEFKKEFDLAYPAHFEKGELYDIPFEDQSMDSVICIDALWTVPDKIRALKEIKRVMKPGAKFIFTNWDHLAIDPITVLELSGLTFIHREETPKWKSYQMKVYDGILNYQNELISEMGETAAGFIISEATTVPDYLDLSVRRIYHMELR